MGREINGPKWEREHPAEARILRSMEGKTLEEMAQATGYRLEATRKQCRALGIKYSPKTNSSVFKNGPKGGWRAPEQYPSVFAYACGVTLRHMQGARA